MVAQREGMVANFGGILPAKNGVTAKKIVFPKPFWLRKDYVAVRTGLEPRPFYASSEAQVALWVLHFPSPCRFSGAKVQQSLHATKRPLVKVS